MLRHIFANLFNSLVVLATFPVGFASVVESTLKLPGGRASPEPLPLGARW